MRIKPDYNLKSIYDIDLEELKSKGIRVIMFDLDSTLMISKSGKFLEKTEQWLERVKRDFDIAIISNNYSEEYLDKAREACDFRVIGAARKPDPAVMQSYLAEVGANPCEACMVGDRPLTDILGGVRLGCTTILVDSINADNEGLPTRFVRWLERLTIKK
ncbi:MAG: YqeG family HAD IIIA-type phosphatase [Candidatus Gastranaerophilales bacterium]|nr:YqeG family HAD IIIA-type phosphatase [Candidatus Gastranaerophilales bacterium]